MLQPIISGIYWADIGDGTINHTDMSLDTTVLVSGLNDEDPWGPRSLTVGSDGKIYFCRKSTTNRCDLDGSNVEMLTSGNELPPPLGFAGNGVYGFHGFSVDVGDNCAFFTDGYNDQVIRTDLDGGNITPVYSGASPMGLGGQRSLALDTVNNRVYWLKYEQPVSDWEVSIKRMDYNGSNLETVAIRIIPDLGDGFPIDWLSVDSYRQRVYWTNAISGLVEMSGINSNVTPQIVESGLNGPDGNMGPTAIFVDAVHGGIYWGATNKVGPYDVGSGTISRGRFDGGMSYVVTSGSNLIWGLFGWLLALVVPEEPELILTKYTKMHRRGGDLIGTFESGVFAVNITVWDVVGGINSVVQISDDECYRIGDTGKWGWSLGSLPVALHKRNRQYYFKMTADTGDISSGQFLIKG